MSKKQPDYKKRKFQRNPDIVAKVRKEVDKEYEDGLPDYLVDYFDKYELDALRAKFYRDKNRRRDKYSSLSVNRMHEFASMKEEKFWENNKAVIVKKPSTSIPRVHYDEPKRATERESQERELTKEEIQVLVSLCSSDLYLFAVRYFPHYLKKPSSKLHKFLYDLFEEEINNTNKIEGCKWAIVAPRANAKSSLVSNIVPLWCICYGKKKFVIIVSDTKGQAEDFLSDIRRELETNVKLMKDFPHVCGKGPIWRQDEIITNSGTKVLALGTGSKIRGRKFGVDRPDLVCCDDLENLEMVRSLTQRTDIKEWLDKDVVFAGGEEGSLTDFFIVGTILGKEALLNKLLDPTEYPDWKGKKFKAVYEFSYSPLWDKWREIYTDRFNPKRKEDAREFFECNKDEMLEDTEVLWPEGDPYYSLMVHKLKNSSSFSSEKQGDPVDPEKIYITLKQLHMVRFKGNPEVEEYLERSIFYGAIDPSVGKNKKSDRYCIVILARDRETGFIFLVDVILKRGKPDQQIIEICKAHMKYGFKKFAIETNAFQYVLAENLRKKSRKLGIYVPIVELQNYTDKVMRIESIFPFVLDGTIVFDKNKYNNNSQYRLAVEQLCDFTGEGDEDDDFPDCLEMGFRIAKKPSFKLLTK